jgi:predicted ATP-grasp superfamily ATP-dependent carboligase
LPEGLATEALGMLWSLLDDFRKWGAVRTLAIFDPRFENKIPGLNQTALPADEVISAKHEDHFELYSSLLKRCDAVLIIAPEKDGVLARFTELAEKTGKPLLCSNSSSVLTAGNKAVCDLLFRQAKLPIPTTRIASFEEASMIAGQIGFPLVLKPIDGMGSEGVYRVSSQTSLARRLQDVRRATSHRQLLMQSYISGIHASVSLLALDGRILPLSLNRQIMAAGQHLEYLGSQVPIHHMHGEQTMELACSAASLIPGLRGYIGVDLVLARDSASLIEINPRITTSYLGLRQVAQRNLAQVIWEACINGIFPNPIPLTSSVTLKKSEPSSWGLT